MKTAIKKPKEERHELWTSTGFKTKAVRYYSKWVALDDVCEVYMLQIKKTRKDLYSFLTENPTIEEAKKNVLKLAETFADNLKKAHEKLAQENKRQLEKKNAYENSK